MVVNWVIMDLVVMTCAKTHVSMALAMKLEAAQIVTVTLLDQNVVCHFARQGFMVQPVSQHAQGNIVITTFVTGLQGSVEMAVEPNTMAHTVQRFVSVTKQAQGNVNRPMENVYVS